MKHEGIFRRACEVTMRVMRNESDSLMRRVFKMAAAASEVLDTFLSSIHSHIC